MPDFDVENRLVIAAVLLLILTAPVAILTLTIAFLQLTGTLLFTEISVIEFLELYIIDLLLFVGFAYGLYRLALRLIREELPESIAALESEEAESEQSEPPG